MPKKSAKYDAQYWSYVETAHSVSGELPSPAEPVQDIYRLLVHDWDARRCDDLATGHDAPIVFKLRALLSRGDFNRADQLLAKLDKGVFEASEWVEILIEKARLYGFQGRWIKAIELIDMAFGIRPVPVSRLTLLQMKAHCLFESGEFESALNCLQRLESLTRLYPECNSAIYADALKVKVLARANSVAEARDALGRLWLSLIKRRTLNIDRVLTLIRVEADLCRVEALPYGKHCLAGWALSENMGDELYAALGLLELFHSEHDFNRSEWEPRLADYASRFELVRRLMREFHEKPGSTTARSMAMFRLIGKRNVSRFDPSSLAKINFLLLPSRKLLLRFRPHWKIYDVTRRPQSIVALQALEKGPLTRRSFFELLWHGLTYKPLQHDPLISRLIYRMKKDFEIPLRLEQDHLDFGHSVLIV